MRSICAAHGAEIEVDSSPGRGSCFRLKFPANQRAVCGEHRSERCSARHGCLCWRQRGSRNSRARGAGTLKTSPSARLLLEIAEHMWIIRTALRYPLHVLRAGDRDRAVRLARRRCARRSTSCPDIKLPVISVVWTYIGMPPADMSNRVITYYERQMTTAVTDIDHIESQSLPGVGVVKVFFHPNVNVNAALSEVTAISQTVLKRLPPGITPPQILSYNASSVPVLQLALSGKTLTDQQLYDLSNNFIRPRLAEVEGAAVPSPYGGKNRQVQVDLDPAALHEKNVDAGRCRQRHSAQNLTAAGRHRKDRQVRVQGACSMPAPTRSTS